MHILFPFPCGRWHISWNLVMIVLLSACQPASQKIILPSKLIPYTCTFFQGYWRSKPPLMYVDNWVAVIKVVICMNLEILNSAFQTLYFYISMHFSVLPGFHQSYVRVTWANGIMILILIRAYTKNLKLQFCHKICFEDVRVIMDSSNRPVISS